MTRTTIAAMALAVLVVASGGVAAYHAGPASIDYDEEDLHDGADVGYEERAEELEDAENDSDDSDDADDVDADDVDADDDSDDSDDADADDPETGDSDNADDSDDSDNADDSDDSDNTDDSDDSDNTGSSDGPSADDFSAHFTTDVVAGESATLKVVDNSGAPVQGVTVEVDGTGVGTTSTDGTVTFQVPDADDGIEVQYSLNGDEKEFTQSVEGASSSDDSSQTNSDMSFSAQFTTDVVAGEDATLEVTYSNGEPVEGATVEVNGDQVGTTNAQGTVTFQVPKDDDGIEVQVAHTGDEQEFTQSVQDA